uniref:7TM GPCR serpentine receptor class x (Srx) domain-containing protein n=1 Tax=Strongyloides stercoralis TaxID=6248 RepID=A0A0K0DX24_STRER
MLTQNTDLFLLNLEFTVLLDITRLPNNSHQLGNTTLALLLLLFHNFVLSYLIVNLKGFVTNKLLFCFKYYFY